MRTPPNWGCELELAGADEFQLLGRAAHSRTGGVGAPLFSRKGKDTSLVTPPRETTRRSPADARDNGVSASSRRCRCLARQNRRALQNARLASDAAVMMRCGEIEILHTSTPAFAWPQRRMGIFRLDDPQFNGKTAMASTRKCLAQSNKSLGGSDLPKKRRRECSHPHLSKLRAEESADVHHLERLEWPIDPSRDQQRENDVGRVAVEVGRRLKFTPERIEQIRNLVERGKTAEIAEIIDVTVGSLQVTCSRLGVSLRRPRSPDFMAPPPSAPGRRRGVAVDGRPDRRRARRPTRSTAREEPRSASSSATAGARRSSTCRSRRTPPRASLEAAFSGRSVGILVADLIVEAFEHRADKQGGHRGHRCHEANSLMPSRVGRLSVEVRPVRRYQNPCHNLSELMISSCPKEPHTPNCGMDALFLKGFAKFRRSGDLRVRLYG